MRISTHVPALQPAASASPTPQPPDHDEENPFAWLRGYNPDALYLSVNPRKEMAMVVKVTGVPLDYKTPAQEAAYIDSLSHTPVSEYDPEGFLARLGLWGIKGAGRKDADFVEAAAGTTWRPNNTDSHGKTIWIQGYLFDKLVHHSVVFKAVAAVGDPVIMAYSRIRHLWKKPFEVKQTAHPTSETPQQRYGVALGLLPRWDGSLTWGEDFHGGVPGEHIHEGGQGYGTWAIARGLGFTAEQAQRLGEMDNGTDGDTTPYGITKPKPKGQIDRHFNMNRRGEDSRLIWAQRHLQQAIAFGRQGSYKEAETELGVGLHSLQDLFAHAQSTPSVHATMGDFLDMVSYSPVGMIEATVATRNYLKAYLKGITSADGSWALPPEPQQDRTPDVIQDRPGIMPVWLAPYPKLWAASPSSQQGN